MSLLVVSVIDLHQFRVPDWLTLPLIVGGLFVAATTGVGAFSTHTLSAVVGFSTFAALAHLYRAKRNTNGLGLGDAKLLAAAGAWLGLSYLAPVVFVGAILALFYVLFLRARGEAISSTTVVPFGPFLSAAFFGFWCLKAAGWLIL